MYGLADSGVDYILLIPGKPNREFLTLSECIRYTTRYHPKRYSIRLRLNKDITRGFEVRTNEIDIKGIKSSIGCNAKQLADHLGVHTGKLSAWLRNGVPSEYKHLFREFK